VLKQQIAIIAVACASFIAAFTYAISLPATGSEPSCRLVSPDECDLGCQFFAFSSVTMCQQLENGWCCDGWCKFGRCRDISTPGWCTDFTEYKWFGYDPAHANTPCNGGGPCPGQSGVCQQS
jgi:hypothetical protein